MFNRLFKILFLLFVLGLSSCMESKNKEALKYRNGSCVAFYAPGCISCFQEAEKLCDSGEELLYDYSVQKAGDYYRLSYGDGSIFYTDTDFHDLKLQVKDGMGMLSDLLRYSMKKDGLDIAYTSAFYPMSSPERLAQGRIDARIAGEELLLFFPDFDYELVLPLAYAKVFCGTDLGYGDAEEFEKKVYIDPKRPMLALTYDDGPYRKVDSRLYEVLSEYGARATFYAVGDRMDADELENIAEGIALGMEFGSHSEHHQNLNKLDLEDALKAVREPVDYVKEKLGYEMKTYRPPYGVRNRELEKVIGMPAILWTVDSKDWSNRDEEITYANIINAVHDGDIILMHSLYMSSAEASERLIPELLDRGFQLVSVTELLESRGYDLDQLKCYGSN